jgi:hypothetical protein
MLLQQGVGLVVIDIVTERRANLHRDLLAHLGQPDAVVLDADLYAAAYRPVRTDEEVVLSIWQEPLTLGRVLPTLPLFLRGGPCVPLDLEGTYERTCREQRIPLNGAVALS